MTAHSRLCPLTDLNLNRISLGKILVGYAVAVWHILKDVPVGCFLLFGKNTPFAAAHCSLCRGRPFCQGNLCLPGECTKAHVRNKDRGFQNHRLLCMLSDHRPHVHLCIIVQRQTGKLGTEQQNLVK